MAKSEGCIEVHVERTRKDGSPVRRVALDVSGGCSIEVTCQDGTAVVQLGIAGSNVRLAAGGPQSDFARAINLLRLHLPRCHA